MAIRRFHWDVVDDCVLYETDGNGDTLVEYTHEPGQFGPLLSENRDGAESYHHYDALGSTTMLTDDAGDVTDTFTFDAWGNQIARTGTTETPYTWVGRWGYQDDSATTGGYYIRARSYQPTVARWSTIDPMPSIGFLFSYLYTPELPVQYGDPSGLLVLHMRDWSSPHPTVCSSGYAIVNLVAKSFINEPTPLGMLSTPWATWRMGFLIARIGSWAAFHENPQTDADDMKNRLYTEVGISFHCCGGQFLDFLAYAPCQPKLWGFNIDSTATRGGYEAFGLRGTINLQGPYWRQVSPTQVRLSWTGWGHPHPAAENGIPGMQWVQSRTSINIWHLPILTITCNNDGTANLDVVDFDGSKFPSRRLWANSVLIGDVTQGTFSDLWTAKPGFPTFVADE